MASACAGAAQAEPRGEFANRLHAGARLGSRARADTAEGAPGPAAADCRSAQARACRWGTRPNAKSGILKTKQCVDSHACLEDGVC